MKALYSNLTQLDTNSISLRLADLLFVAPSLSSGSPLVNVGSGGVLPNKAHQFEHKRDVTVVL